MEKRKQLICSGIAKDKYESDKKFLGSSKKDYVKEGYQPTQQGKGVLMHWDNIPIGYYGIPTANRMIYSERLWDALLNNFVIKQMLETGSFWMENDHKDSDEVLLSQVAGRITNWEKADHNLIIGGIDIVDTPEGNKTYILASLGDVGTSTRGFGVLDDLGNGLTNVNEEEYIHVDSDFVGCPAVPVSRISSLKDPITSLVNTEDEELRKLVLQCYEKNPNDLQLLQLANAASHGKYEDRLKEKMRLSKIAASLKRHN